MLCNQLSDKFLLEAEKYIPGGVNSPVRAFKSVGGGPLFIKKGQGAYIYDVDGNKYIDYLCSWGPLILGHCPSSVIKAVSKSLLAGTSFGAPTEYEIVLARMLVEALPAVEMVRLVNSGTEAVMSAIRLARGYTHRERIIKFDGCYHGHSDGLLAQSGSGIATLSIPGSPGVPEAYVKTTTVLPFNDTEAVQQAFDAFGSEIAAVIVEPIAGNMGVVLPEEGFLATLRKLTEAYESLLIFDEVITGFRVARGGAQSLYGIYPDLTTLGKIIGGGFPLAAYGGKKNIMELVAPLGPVYQAGTLSGNPVAVTAGINTLSALTEEIYQSLEHKGEYLEKGLREAAANYKVAIQINRVGSMLSIFFTDQPVRDFTSAKTTSTDKFAIFFWSMLDQGINLPPSAFETFFISSVHTEEDLNKTIAAANQAFKEVKQRG